MADDGVGQGIVKYGREVLQDIAAQLFVGAIVGSPAREAGAWLADSIRYKRWKGQLRILAKAQGALERADIGPHAVNLTILVSLLEAGSLTEDEEMQDRLGRTSSARR